jgi:hypothetical protein
LPWQYGIIPITLALALLSKFFCYSLKLNFICYLNRFLTFDYSLWDEGRHSFLRAKTNFILYKRIKFPSKIVFTSQSRIFLWYREHLCNWPKNQSFAQW